MQENCKDAFLRIFCRALSEFSWTFTVYDKRALLVLYSVREIFCRPQHRGILRRVVLPNFKHKRRCCYSVAVGFTVSCCQKLAISCGVMSDPYTPEKKLPIVPAIIIGLLLAALVAVVFVFSSRVEAAQQAATDTHTKLMQASADLSKLQGDLDATRAELAAARKEVNDEKLAGAKLQRELTASGVDLARQQRALDESKAKLAKLADDLQQAENREAEAHEQTTEAQTQCARLARELSDAKVEVNQSGRQLEEVRTKLADTQAKLAAAQEQLSSQQTAKKR